MVCMILVSCVVCVCGVCVWQSRQSITMSMYHTLCRCTYYVAIHVCECTGPLLSTVVHVVVEEVTE